MNATPKAVIYCRVSTEEQAEHGTSLETQELSCLRKAADLGAQVIARYRDEGVSGGLYLTREGIQQALADIECGRADLLIVAKRDRMARDVDAARDIQKRIARAGGRVISCDGLTFDDNAVGRLMATQIDGFAEYERAVIRERTMSGCRRLAEKGMQPSRSRRPFGYYVVNKQDVLTGKYSPELLGRYVVNDEEARWVREMFGRYSAGQSLNSVVTWLNGLGVPTPKDGECWRRRTVLYILENPVYKGQATYGLRESLHDERRRTELGFKTTAYQRVRAAGPVQYIEAPAVVDERTWQTCQDRLAEGRARFSGNPRRLFLLTGVARCPVCGRGLAGKKFQQHAYYTCNRIDPAPHRPQRYYRADDQEQYLVTALDSILGTPDCIQGAFEAYRCRKQARRRTPDDVADRLRGDLAQLEAKEKAAARAQVDALVQGRSADVYERLLSDLDNQKQALRSRLDVLADEKKQAEDFDPSASAITAQHALAALRTVLTADDVLTTQERREVIRGFVEEILPLETGCKLTLKPFYEGETVQKTVVMYTVLDGASIQVNPDELEEAA